MDSYYRDFSDLTPDELERVNWDHPDAFDSALLAEHLEALANVQGVDCPVYDFASHSRSRDTSVPQ